MKSKLERKKMAEAVLDRMLGKKRCNDCGALMTENLVYVWSVQPNV